MERLTEKHYKKNGGYFMKCSEWCEREETMCMECERSDEVVDRLGAIEDILGDDYDLDRLRELVEADRDGRCVVLPKDGMVYYIEEAGGEKWIANKPIQQITVKCGWGIASIEFSLLDAGKYFTREAAEAALKGERHENQT